MPAAIDLYLQMLRAAGLDFRVSADLGRDIDHVGNLIEPGPRPRRFDDLAPRPIVEHDDIEQGLGSDHASMAVAFELRRLGSELKGLRVLELGCGTGLLAIQAAMHGAQVVGTDLDERVLELAERNARSNEVEIDWRKGSLCEPLAESEEFDLVIANLPHKPSLRAGVLPLSQDGGRDGGALFAVAGAELARRMPPGGRLIFFMHSLPHPRVLIDLSRLYDLELRRWKLRFLAAGEYGELVNEFRARSRDGRSFVHAEGGREALVACVWEGRRRDGST